MKLNKGFWIKLGIESLLIVFSVLLALALNEYRNSSKEKENTALALRSIRAELKANQEILKEWQQIHSQMLDTLQTLIETQQPAASFFSNGRFLFEKTIPAGTFIPQMLRSTAWEAAKTSGTLQTVDPELLSLLTDVYTLQEVAVFESVKRILQLFFDRQSHQENQLNTTLVLLSMNLQELKGQEAVLSEVYGNAIAELDSYLQE